MQMQSCLKRGFEDGLKIKRYSVVVTILLVRLYHRLILPTSDLPPFCELVSKGSLCEYLMNWIFFEKSMFTKIELMDECGAVNVLHLNGG
ncbi:unnamed protein product [Allacma fusca]|uniref:Uncharacterized protein n=1 Tax=Allacma fusca TaxID=39272 RepID=A0A8J2MDA5_9HEXA|nr:unnamed protein product [Allacma fusca]